MSGEMVSSGEMEVAGGVVVAVGISSTIILCEKEILESLYCKRN